MIVRSPKELAVIITNQRKQLGLSQTTVAERVGLKQKTISAFENNPESVMLETAFLILSALSLHVEVSPKNKVSSKKGKWIQEW